MENDYLNKKQYVDGFIYGKLRPQEIILPTTFYEKGIRDASTRLIILDDTEARRQQAFDTAYLGAITGHITLPQDETLKSASMAGNIFGEMKRTEIEGITLQKNLEEETRKMYREIKLK